VYFTELDTLEFMLRGKKRKPDAILEDRIVYKKKDYLRYWGPANPFQEAMSSKRRFYGGTTGRILYKSRHYVYKTAGKGKTDHASACEEVSCTLQMLAKGIPHAECYGIYENDGVYYSIEERLDTERFRNQMRMVKECLRALPLVPKILYCKEYDWFLRYVSQFQTIVSILKAQDVGGDFKLENMGYRRGTSELVLMDVSIPCRRKKYESLSWKEWSTMVQKEEPLDVFLNPLSRLAFLD
jgi:hypothetical protein